MGWLKGPRKFCLVDIVILSKSHFIQIILDFPAFAVRESSLPQKLQIIIFLIMDLVNISFFRRVHVPTCEEVSWVIFGHINAGPRDIHDDSVVSHLAVLAESNGDPAFVGPAQDVSMLGTFLMGTKIHAVPVCAVVHLYVSIFVTPGQPVC